MFGFNTCPNAQLITEECICGIQLLYPQLYGVCVDNTFVPYCLSNNMPSTFDCYCENVLVPIGVTCYQQQKWLKCSD